MSLSPGVKYLAAKLPIAVATPLATHYALKSLSEHGFSLLDGHTWLRALVILCSLPLLSYCYKISSDLHTKLEARRSGAQLFPIVRGSWPYSLDMILKFLRAFPTEYAGENFLSVFPPNEKTVILDATGELRGMLASGCCSYQHLQRGTHHSLRNTILFTQSSLGSPSTSSTSLRAISPTMSRANNFSALLPDLSLVSECSTLTVICGGSTAPSHGLSLSGIASATFTSSTNMPTRSSVS